MISELEIARMSMVPRPVISPTLALGAAWSTNCSVVRALMNACSRACCSILTLP